MCFVFYFTVFFRPRLLEFRNVANAISFQFVPRVIARERTLGITGHFWAPGHQGATRAKNSSLVSDFLYFSYDSKLCKCMFYEVSFF